MNNGVKIVMMKLTAFNPYPLSRLNGRPVNFAGTKTDTWCNALYAVAVLGGTGLAFSPDALIDERDKPVVTAAQAVTNSNSGADNSERDSSR